MEGIDQRIGEITSMLETLLGVLSPPSIVAIASDKQQKPAMKSTSTSNSFKSARGG